MTQRRDLFHTPGRRGPGGGAWIKQPPGHSVGNQRDGSALDGADAASGRHQPCQCFLFFSGCWTGVGCLIRPLRRLQFSPVFRSLWHRDKRLLSVAQTLIYQIKCKKKKIWLHTSFPCWVSDDQRYACSYPYCRTLWDTSSLSRPVCGCGLQWFHLRLNWF